MSLITEKYDYKEIKRKQVDGKRLYACPDGNAVASVTTILDKTKDKSHLIAWRKRVGEQKAQEIVTEAASVGTRMHKYLEVKIKAKILLSAVTGIECATLAPNGTVIKVPTTIPTSAGKYT